MKWLPSEKKFRPQFSVSKSTMERRWKIFSQPSHSNDARIENICTRQLPNMIVHFRNRHLHSKAGRLILLLINYPQKLPDPTKNYLGHTKLIDGGSFQINNQSLTKVGSDIIYWISGFKTSHTMKVMINDQLPHRTHHKPGES